VGAAGTASGAETICAGSVTCGEGFEATSSAGDLVKIRHSRASVDASRGDARPCRSCRVEQIFGAGSFRQFLADGLLDHARAGEADESAGSAICTSPSMA